MMAAGITLQDGPTLLRRSSANCWSRGAGTPRYGEEPSPID